MNSFPIIYCSVTDDSDTLKQLSLRLSTVALISYLSIAQLLVVLTKITENEYDLSYPLLVVLGNLYHQKKPVKGTRNILAAPIDHLPNNRELPIPITSDSSVADLSICQLKQLLTMFFKHLNLIVVSSQQILEDPVLDYNKEISINHQIFLKNRYKRMKSWIGVNNYENNLSYSVKDKLNKNQDKPFTSQTYPIPPRHVSSMNKNLSVILSYNNNYVSSYDQDNSQNPSQGKYLEMYDRYLELLLNGIDYSEIFNGISEDRRFVIEEFLVESWNFPAHTLSYNELVYVCYLVFKRVFELFGPESQLVLSDNKLLAFLFKVRDFYNGGNEFHNFRHAVDVVQAIFFYCLKLSLVDKKSIISKKMLIHGFRRSKATQTIISEPDSIIDKNEQTIDNNDDLSKEPEELDPLIEYSIYEKSPKLYLNQLKSYAHLLGPNWGSSADAKLLNRTELLCLIISALGHDSGHPGLTNAFVSKNDSPLSKIFSQSILENYHFIIFNELLERYWPELFIPENIAAANEGKPVDVNKIICQSILATDMERHFSFIEKISELKEASKNKAAVVEIPKGLLCLLLLKCADISNVTRPLKLSAKWGTTLGRELAEISTLTNILASNKKLQKTSTQSEVDKLLHEQEFQELLKAYEADDDNNVLQFVKFLKTGLPVIESTIEPTLRSIIEANPSFSASQTFFVEKISYRLFEKISEVLPGLNFTEIIMKKNLLLWKGLQNKH